jgi:DNA polymerase-3 subunit alpha
VVIQLSEAEHAERGLEELQEILRGYPGNCELQLVLRLADGSRVHLKSDSVGVALSAEMRARVEALVGPGNVRLIAAPPKPTTIRSPNGQGARAPSLV